MSTPREPLRRVCIAGGGQVGVLAAIGIKRALPRCEVMVVGLAPDLLDFADHACTALPFTNRLHDRLGIAEDAIVARAGGSHRLVTRYFGWGGEGQYGALSYGAEAGGGAASAFAREWGGGSRAASGGHRAGSLAEALADSGRFAPPPPDLPPGDATPLAEIDYALRWNPQAYRGLLIGEAQRLGIAHVEGPITGVEPDGQGGIASLTLAGAEPITADLFLDCSGSGAALLLALPDHAADEWGHPRRVLFAPPGQPMLALEDRVSLLPEGWLVEFAGRDGLQTILGAADGAGEEVLTRALGSEPVFDARVERGGARAAWLGNVVALGDAVARFEPLGFLHLDLAHRMLALLLELLPGREIEPLERAEFNRRAGQMIDGMRHTLGTHYAAPRAREVFGDAANDSVATTLDQFARRGRLPFRDELPLAGPERVALLRALGHPEGTPPQDRAADPRAGEVARAAFEAKVQAALRIAPPYAQWLQSRLAPTR